MHNGLTCVLCGILTCPGAHLNGTCVEQGAVLALRQAYLSLPAGRVTHWSRMSRRVAPMLAATQCTHQLLTG